MNEIVDIGGCKVVTKSQDIRDMLGSLRNSASEVVFTLASDGVGIENINPRLFVEIDCQRYNVLDLLRRVVKEVQP